MQIDIDALLKFMTIAIGVGSGLYTWLASKDRATALQFRELELRFNALDGRVVKSDLENQAKVQALDAQLKNVPDKEAIHKLELGMQEVRGAVDQMKDQWTQLQHSFRRLEEYLLDARAQTVAPAAPSRTPRRSSK